MKKLGKDISEEEVKAAIQAHDIAKDGQISFEEFTKMLMGEIEVSPKGHLKEQLAYEIESPLKEEGNRV